MKFSGKPPDFHSIVKFACFALFFSAFVAAPAHAKTYPEIVRISYMQGDVRLNRGDGKKPDLTKQWEEAVPNVTILNGYAIATGDGRAEIEFEYGTVVYLAENSVLMFQALSTQDGMPSSRMELVTGTATVSYHPIPKESFVLTTPTQVYTFGNTALSRVDSFLDATALTPQIGGSPGTTFLATESGETDNDPNSPASAEVKKSSGTPLDWDSWVGARDSQRQKNTVAALKASNLTGFIPGLLDLYNEGSFFPCPPFGTCWEPNVLAATPPPDTTTPGAAPPPAATPQTPSATPWPDATPSSPSPAPPSGRLPPAARFQLVAMRVGSQQPDAQQGGAAGTQQAPPPSQAPGQGSPTTPQGTPPKRILKSYSDYFPAPNCYSYDLEIHTITVKDPATGKEKVVRRDYNYTPQMWEYALCHSGAWVHLRGRQTRYTFVVGRKHHHPPVRWGHMHGKDYYVPRHPSDVKGKPPLNLKYGVFETTNGPDGPFHRVDYSPKDKFRPLSQPPKDFRGPDFPPLPGTPQPVIQARLIRNGNRGVPITYDYASKKFVQAGAPIAGRPAPPVVIANFGAHAEYFRPPVSIGGTGGTNGGGGSSGGSHGRSGGGGGSPPRSGGGGAPRGGGGGGSPRGGGGGGAPRGGGGGGAPRGGGGSGGGGGSSGGGGGHSGGGGGSSGGGGGGGGTPRH